ncbi:HAD family hydrolase [Rhodococcus sp. HNM0569]|uniref:HAD family hydrolase n=1 Tax=Rhodococcus sp. HNM0569 TaxID=2716340 RepID=UPI00146C94A1|nr:HAD family hydrolase [Rhodococcus sp. HNM0569]NLU83392.1 HAD family hydrolase [Rhodococcus sp. HNM0569]
MTTSWSSAVLFDIDGTLVDSNYQHVDAWTRAFEDVDHPVAAWLVHRAIGMDGSRLLEVLLPDADDAIRDRAKDLHLSYYEQHAQRLRPLPGARDLVAHLAEAGVAVVLASSSSREELAILREVLDVDAHVAAVTNASDVETAKPRPELVAVALGKVGVAASAAVLVGDAVYDMAAAVRAGVPAVGVLSGGIGADELTVTGASAVFDDAADLLENLDRTPIREMIQ